MILNLFFLGAVLAQATLNYKQFLDEVNAVRARNGVPPVCLSDKLNKSAQVHSEFMKSTNNMVHTAIQDFLPAIAAQGFSAGTAAENIAQTMNFDLKTAADLIANDPPHLANIIGAQYTHVGFGAAGTLGGNVFWTQHFAKPMQGVEPCSAGDAAPAANPGAALGVQTPLGAQPPAVPGALGGSQPPAMPTPQSGIQTPPGQSPQQGLNSILGGFQQSPNVPQSKSFDLPPRPPCVGAECWDSGAIVPPLAQLPPQQAPPPQALVNPAQPVVLVPMDSFAAYPRPVV